MKESLVETNRKQAIQYIINLFDAQIKACQHEIWQAKYELKKLEEKQKLNKKKLQELCSIRNTVYKRSV